jgi:hypothetical protein
MEWTSGAISNKANNPDIHCVTTLILVVDGVVLGHGGLSILLSVIFSFMAFVNFVALLNLLGLAFTDISLIDVVTGDPVDGAAANVLWLAITNTLHVNEMGETLDDEEVRYSRLIDAWSYPSCDMLGVRDGVVQLYS